MYKLFFACTWVCLSSNLTKRWPHLAQWCWLHYCTPQSQTHTNRLHCHVIPGCACRMIWLYSALILDTQEPVHPQHISWLSIQWSSPGSSGICLVTDRLKQILSHIGRDALDRSKKCRVKCIHIPSSNKRPRLPVTVSWTGSLQSVDKCWSLRSLPLHL